jgi:hypothetical protein
LHAGWMPLVLVVTWSNRSGHPEPILQLRTEANSSRELERMSHLAGYVYLDPYPAPGTPSVAGTPEFELSRELTEFTAQRRVRMETGSAPPEEVSFVTTREYLHADKEHLFFFIYSLELPGHFQFPQRAHMCHLTVERLLAIRKNQALRNALQLCRPVDMLHRPEAASLEIVALNLTLHDLPDVGGELLSVTNSPGAAFQNAVRRIEQLERESRQSQRSGGLEVELTGLSGLQYREFFTVLLPLYDKIGVPGAAEQLAAVRDDKEKRHTLDRLATLYHDEAIMTSIPVEL